MSAVANGIEAGRCWEDISVGDVLDGYDLVIDAVRLASTPSVTLDAFAGHVDVGYARLQGHPTTFMNSLPLLGLLDRLVTDWAGPHTFIRRHKINLQRPVYCGDIVTVSGRVSAIDDSVLPGFGRMPKPCSSVELHAVIKTPSGVAGRGEITAALPRRCISKRQPRSAFGE